MDKPYIRDVGEALARVGDSAEETGVSFHQLIALVTVALEETGRGGAVIGNTLNTLFNRLQHPNAIRTLRENFKIDNDDNPIDILSKISANYDDLNFYQKRLISEILGGAFQVGQLKHILEVYHKSLAIADKATEELAMANASLDRFSEIDNKFSISAENLTIALQNINTLLKINEKELSTLRKGLFDVAKDTKQSFSAVSEAALEFSRQGLGLEETLKRTRNALILTQLSGLKVEKSVESLTAAGNASTKNRHKKIYNHGRWSIDNVPYGGYGDWRVYEKGELIDLDIHVQSVDLDENWVLVTEETLWQKYHPNDKLLKIQFTDLSLRYTEPNGLR